MALRTIKDWISWLSDLFEIEESRQYATSLVESQITEDELSELSHELLKEMNITVTGHRMKILKKVKGTSTVPISTKMVKSDIKLPHINMSCSPSQFRKFLIDWDIYKSEHGIIGVKCNKLVYSACDETLQNSIINGVPGFLEIPEEKLIQYIKDTATKMSNPTVYRLSFQRLDQLEHHSIDQYVDTLRDKAIDCEFVCPSESCQYNYAEFAIRDRFIQGLHDKKIQTNILSHISMLPTLQDVIKHAKSIEAAKNDVSSMEVINRNVQEESYVNRVSSYKKNPRNNTQSSNSQSIGEECTGCGKKGHGNYPARKANCPAWGKTCNKCGVRNHFSNVCKRKESSALALIAHTSDQKQDHNTSDFLPVQITPVCPKKKMKSITVSVYPDSGADLCLAGVKHMQQLGLSRSDLNDSMKVISTAGKYKIETFGWCHVIFNHTGTETRQPVYFSQQIQRFYLSKVACKGIKILPVDFPHGLCNRLTDNKENTEDSIKGNNTEDITEDKNTEDIIEVNTEDSTEEKESERKLPVRPTEIPFPPTEENIEKMEQYLKEKFANSTFNTSPPFPAMAKSRPALIHVRSDAVPYAKHVPIPAPLHWADPLKNQLDTDVDKGVIEKVPQGDRITWCAQMVPIQKKDGSIRRTVDYQRLNSQCDRETHHCPPPFLLATQIPANVKKTIFDAVDGYHAVPLHEDSKHLTTFITQWGAYRYCRLPQGFLASADAYTRRYDDLISHIPRKVKCIDDVLLWDKDITTSFFRAWDFLEFCFNNGIVLSQKKFKFCRDDVEFAGLQITSSGIAPSKKILKAIEDFPTPTCLTDARSWFGLVNQVSWAHSDGLAMAPFRALIKPNTKFYWDIILEDAFQKSKRHIIGLVKRGVTKFDMSKPTCLYTDWSQQGIGFLLMQKHCSCEPIDPKCCKLGWQLTYAGSRFTTEAESRYSPTEGEALAVAWSMNRSKFFTLGCKNLIVATDHQPLHGLFKKQLNDISNPRLLRIRSKTLMFSFNVIYTPASSNKGADAVSRNPVGHDDLIITDEEVIDSIPHSVIARLNDDSTPAEECYIPYAQLQEAIEKDVSYPELQRLISKGFPANKHEIPSNLQCFWGVRDRLTLTRNDVILMDQRIVIPANYRASVLKLLHSAHQGISSMRSRANESVYWPFMKNDIKNIRINCTYCNSIAPRQTKEPLILTPDPDFPFQQIAADFFTIKKHDYLVMVDRYSGWFTISYFKVHQATARNLIRECSALFSAYGAPEIFSTDGGPQFKSHEFQMFLADWGVQHRLSSAYYPQSNGRAEAAVKTAKRILTEYVKKDEPMDRKRIAQAVLQHRNTPLPHLNLSPAQLLFHRKLRDKIPTHPSHLRLHKKWILASKQREVLYKKRNEAAQMSYNSKSKLLSPLKPRTKVLLLTNDRNPRWTLSGMVVRSLPYRQYKVRLDGSGRIIIRNRKFLREYFSKNAREDAVDSTPEPPVTSRSEPPAAEIPSTPELPITPLVNPTIEHQAYRPSEDVHCTWF